MNKLIVLSIMIMALLSGIVYAGDAINLSDSTVSVTGNSGTTLTSPAFNLSNIGDTTVSVSFSNYTLTQVSGTRTITLNSLSTVSNLAAGANQSLTASVATDNSFAATYTGLLRAAVTTNTTAFDTVPVSVTINPSPLLTASPVSITTAPEIAQTGQLTLANTGNTDLSGVTVSVGTLTTGTNTLPSSAVTLSSSSINVAYGANTAVTVTVNPPAGQAVGTYTGTVTVNYGGTSAATATLTVVVRNPTRDVQFSASTISIGSSTQERERNITSTFTLRNTGDYTETVTLSLNDVDNRYNAVISPTSFTLAPGTTSGTITLSLFVPDNQDSDIKTIGQVSASYTNATKTADIRLNTVSKLRINDVNVDVGGESDNDVGENDTIGDPAMVEDEVVFTIDVENLFSDNDDIKIEDVKVNILIEGIDDGDDIDEDSEKNDIEQDSEESFELSFTVPLEADDETYTVTITAEGDDENGATHTATRTVKLEVEKENDDVRITRAELGSQTIQCGESTSLAVQIRNFGKDDQNEAALVVYSKALGINQKFTDIELDSDTSRSSNKFSRSVDINTDKYTAVGTYVLDINAYVNDDEEMDSETVSLKVEACSPEPAADTDTDSSDVDTGAGSGSQDQDTDSDVVESVEVPFTESTAFIGLIVLANLVVLGGIVFMVLKFLL